MVEKITNTEMCQVLSETFKNLQIAKEKGASESELTHRRERVQRLVNAIGEDGIISHPVG